MRILVTLRQTSHLPPRLGRVPEPGSACMMMCTSLPVAISAMACSSLKTGGLTLSISLTSTTSGSGCGGIYYLSQRQLGGMTTTSPGSPESLRMLRSHYPLTGTNLDPFTISLSTLRDGHGTSFPNTAGLHVR